MNKIYMIGNAHIDPVWLWRWQDGYSEVLATFRSALDRMKEFPDYIFTSACAQYYMWVEENDPRMFEEIRQRVAEGRWCLAGGWMLQPDCNLPSAESFARHGLLAQRYFKEKFGQMAVTGYNVDSFGHNRNLPAILRNSGMKNYIFMRPGEHENAEIPDLFRWQAQDGSEVLTFRIYDRYCIVSENYDDIMKRIRERSGQKDIDMMAFYGVGNHGGGPTVELLRKIEKERGTDLLYSSPDRFFEEQQAKSLPLWQDEMQHHAPGCYSATSLIKRMNRRAENALLAAERIALLAAAIAGSAYPSGDLSEAWNTLLFNQFHDIMGGCAIRPAYEDAGNALGHVLFIADLLKNRSAQRIMRDIDTLRGTEVPGEKVPRFGKVWIHPELGTPIVVFNTATVPLQAPAYIAAAGDYVTDENGTAVPSQKVRGPQTNGPDDEMTMFTAEVPALGYRVYRLFEKKPDDARDYASDLRDRRDLALENDRILVEFDESSGEIRRFVRKDTGQEVIGSSCRAILLDDAENDTWAHGRALLGPEKGVFGSPSLHMIENGRARKVLRIEQSFGDNILTRDYILASGCDLLSVKVRLNARDKHTVFKLCFPVLSDRVISQAPFGTVTRKADRGEECTNAWAASDDLLVLNNGIYSYDAKDGELRLTLARTAIFADHFGQNYRDEFCEYADLGITEWEYAIGAFTTPQDAEAKQQILNQPLLTLTTHFHKGSLPESFCGLQTEGTISVSAVKKCEDNDHALIRFYETDGREGTAMVRLLGAELTASVHPHEIVTEDSAGRKLDFLEFEKEDECAPEERKKI